MRAPTILIHDQVGDDTILEAVVVPAVLDEDGNELEPAVVETFAFGPRPLGQVEHEYLKACVDEVGRHLVGLRPEGG